MTSELKPGTALGHGQIRSNERRPPMSDRMTTVPVAGHDSGSDVAEHRPRARPSTRAASKVLLRGSRRCRDVDERRDAEALPHVDPGHADEGEVRIGNHPGPLDAEDRQGAVDQTVERVEQHLEGQAHPDGGHEHGEEGDGSQVSAPDDLRRQEHREREPQHDLEALVTTALTTVFTNASDSCGSEKNCTKLSSPRTAHRRATSA